SEFIRLAGPLTGGSEGARWLRDLAADLEAHRHLASPLEIFRLVGRHASRQPRRVTKRDTFAADDRAWKVWNRYTKGRGGPASLRDEMLAPVDRHVALRLARLFPVVVALYEKVKARRRTLDRLDLLVKLRDLLAGNLVVRGELGGLFDHILVDEFQDTDPLQAEIVLFLCEREPRAARWTEVELRPGALTLVGDPKQSIYRFRRADIAMYDRVRAIVARSPHLPIRLSANFRSVPLLIEWLNDRFARILGVDPGGRPFDADTGRVFQQPLAPGRPGAGAPPVHVLRYDLPGGDGKADEYRALEGCALARYLRWLVEASDVRIQDPVDGQPRAVRFGDVAVLAISTYQLDPLFPSLDAEGVPYTSRGGKLFLGDPLHRQFLLGLRAIADRDDGVAEAALLRPPFFAVDLAELARHRMGGPESPPGSPSLGSAPGDPGRSSTHASGDGNASHGDDEGRVHDDGGGRVREARELVRELRRRRFDRPPGATARDLLERTAFARTVAVRENGAQRLARLRELCLVLEERAARDGLDFDAVTARMRQWVTDPIQLDPPHPVGTEAIQVLTVHQAKGLEFPVVVLWDGMHEWTTRVQQSPWRLQRDGPGWIMSLDGLRWEEPAGLGLRQIEQSYLEAERRRLVYVAATRARDLLVVPQAGVPAPARYICDALLDKAAPSLVREMDIFHEGAIPAWGTQVGPPRTATASGQSAMEQEAAERWTAAAAGAARPRFRPVAVSQAARVGRPADPFDSVAVEPAKEREGRFGSVFGNTVHLAIGHALRAPGMAATDAVRRAVVETGLADHLDDAVADVERALEALRLAGVPAGISQDLQIEYPVAGILREGELSVGYIDLVAATPDQLLVLDFKTDPAPADSVDRTYPRYAAQVRAYAQLLADRGPAPALPVRRGLLFTEDGRIRWVE
ncbi:MAG TPA: UvrD-helicase domain-containing protein, partial [Vicinamibacteria bacterium]|nr:UvrD-helicase domain-containing protein [Vicinamibacteria bacterium]